MKIVTKRKVVRMEVAVNTVYGARALTIDIDDKEVVFRSNGLRTECSVKEAKQNWSYISNAIEVLIDGIYSSDHEALIRAVGAEV